ncbi:MAG: hypothetical protein R3C49_08090 [Planctomycetaceae bacterium]
MIDQLTPIRIRLPFTDFSGGVRWCAAAVLIILTADGSVAQSPPPIPEFQPPVVREPAAKPAVRAADILFIPPTNPTPNVQPKSSLAVPGHDQTEQHLRDLQKQKQESMEELHHRAAELARSWRARKAREALAELRAAERQQELEAEKRLQEQAAAAGANAAQPGPMDQTGSASLSGALNSPPNPTQDPQTAAHGTGPSDHTPANVAETSPLQGQPGENQPEVELETAAHSATGAEVVTPEAAAPESVVPVDGPIDRLALATSLFATHQYRECLQTLESVVPDELSEENRDWVGYLSASCFRKLDNFPEAESRYRELLDKNRTPWISAGARWWLDHLNEQQKVRTEIAQLNSTIDAWKEEINGLKQTP